MQTVLLVIDVQDSFYHRDYFREDEMPVYQAAQNELIRIAKDKGWEVVYILHVEPEGVFSEASGYVKPMSWLDKEEHDKLITKRVHNAFTGTELDSYLREKNVSHIVISGIRTEQCCETNARVASDLGYQVDFVVDATLTFPMQHSTTGRVFSADEIKERTTLVLEDRFAQIRHVSDYS